MQGGIAILRPAIQSCLSHKIEMKKHSLVQPIASWPRSCFSNIGVLERVMGLEPTISCLEESVLPLNYTRKAPRRTGLVTVQVLHAGTVTACMSIPAAPVASRDWFTDRRSPIGRRVDLLQAAQDGLSGDSLRRSKRVVLGRLPPALGLWAN